MFKKAILMSTAVAMTLPSFAQKAKLREASRELNSAIEARAFQDVGKETQSLQLAKEAIDQVVQHESTKEDPKAWLTRADIYTNLNYNESFKSVGNMEEAYSSLKKAGELDSKILRDGQYANIKYQISIDYYNYGVEQYDKSDYTKSYEYLGQVQEVLKEEQPNMFKDIPMTDTIRSTAMILQAYAAFYGENNKEAINLLSKAKEDPIQNNTPDLYYLLAEAYSKDGNEQKMLATLEEGLAKFPGNDNLVRLELNYYLTSGNEEQMIGKLKEAIKAQPNDPQLVFNLGIIYSGLAESSQGEQKEKYLNEAFSAYKKALELDPQEGKFLYQLGVFHYNKAAEVNSIMDNLSLNEQKKYEELMVERNGIFNDAIPYLEDARALFQRNARNLSHDEKLLYRENLVALANIYSVLDKMDLATEVRNEIDTIR